MFMNSGRSVRIALLVVFALTLSMGSASAHSGGLDSNGGHYCRDAGYAAGTCSPLGSYHCHQSGCVDYDGATGNGGGGSGGGDGGGSSEPSWDVYRPASSGLTGDKMRARRMLGLIVRASERGGYSYYRDLFPHWADLNSDGCDTRQAVLISESRVSVDREASCTVNVGRWYSVYDGLIWRNPSAVDVDHHVALKEAWVSGAHAWSRDRRTRYANDLMFRGSLNAMTDNLNQSKSDRDPAEWLPNRARCFYAVNWVQVKYRWRLKANPVELDTLNRIMRGTCGDRAINIPKRAAY